MQSTGERTQTTSTGSAASGGQGRSRKRFELLEECRELILGRLGEVIAQALNLITDELTTEGLRAKNPERQKALLDAVMLVRENRSEIETRFRRSFGDVFERRLFAINRPDEAESTTPSELELVSDDAINARLSVDRLIGRARNKLDPDEVLGIRARFGALLERDWFEETQHPASPEAVFEALKAALAELSPRPEVKAALLDAFEPHVSQNLNDIYVAVNERLRAQHVLPRIRPQVQQVGSAAAGGVAGARRAGGPNAADDGAAQASGPWVAGSFGVVHPHGAPHPQAFQGGYPQAAQGGYPQSALGEYLQNAPVAYPPADGGSRGPAQWPGAMGGPQPAGPGAPYPGLGMPGDADADGFDASTFSPDDPLAALQQAMTAASEGRPAGRMHVARMLSNPSMFGVADIPVAPVEQPLVASLTALQRGPLPIDAASMLPEIVQRVREQGSPLDQITVEIVSMVFDYIYADRRLPDPIKQQLLRLQVVAVKAALLDRSFFARRQHPMRRLLDRISDVGADPDADLATGSPLIEGLSGVVDRIIAGFDADLGVFDQALDSIEALAAEEAARRAAELEATAREAALQEAIGIAQDEARVELGRRLDKDSPPFVREFLNRWWTLVLAQLRASHGGGAAQEAWETGLRTADYLVWSVAPKQSDEITRLATVLPGLIRGLNQGLAIVDIDPAERAAFFDELLRAHALEIAAVKKRATPAQPALPVRAPIAVRLQEDGTVRFVAKKPDAQAPQAPPPVSAVDTLLASLQRGQHIELAGDEGVRVLKLAWISPARKLFILTRHPDESLKLQGNELAFLLQRGQARIATVDSALDRAIDSVTGEPQRPEGAPQANGAPVAAARADAPPQGAASAGMAVGDVPSQGAPFRAMLMQAGPQAAVPGRDAAGSDARAPRAGQPERPVEPA